MVSLGDAADTAREKGERERERERKREMMRRLKRYLYQGWSSFNPISNPNPNPETDRNLPSAKKMPSSPPREKKQP
eukprot:137227-Amorphochlora_amoeboformis.AAC.1